MKSVVVFVTIIILIFSFNGCSTQEAPSYFPLKEGARWEYSLQLKGPFGDTETRKMVTTIDGIETIDGKQYKKIVSIFHDVEVEISFYRKTSDGIFMIPENDIDKPEQILLPFPPDVGRNWSLETSEMKYDSRIESIEDVYLSDRKYENCLKVVSEGTLKNKPKSNFNTISYYAPSVGLVRSTSNFPEIESGITMILENYNY